MRATSDQCDCDLYPVTLRTRAADTWGVETRIAIRGMHCSACVDRVRAALHELSGISGADVSLRTGVALVRYDPSRVTEEALVATISRAAGKTQHAYRAATLR